MNRQASLLGMKQAVLFSESDLWRHAAVRPLADHEAPLAEHQIPRPDGRDFSRLSVHASRPEEVSHPLPPRRFPFGGACQASPVRVQAKRSTCQATDSYEQVPPIVHEALRSPGQPLDPATLAFMEPRFGHDFSQVRVHADARSAECARAVNALAYTVGRDVVFGVGQYAPHTNAGRKLMAHELIHMVQQENAATLFPGISVPNDALEHESDKLADSIMTDRAVIMTPRWSNVPGVQRSVDSSNSSSGGTIGGGPQPTPTRNPDGSCQCRLDVCWRPIQLWYVPRYFKHGFINIIDSKCRLHNLYVDPGRHGGHSHAVDGTPGWDNSGERCLSFPADQCTIVDKLPAATVRYESLDVAYDATGGPNSNSFIEWILNEATGWHLPAGHPGLQAWDYYQQNPSHRSSPPRFKRTAVPGTGTAAPAGTGP